MKLMLDSLKHLGLNQRVLGEADFFKIRDREGFIYEEIPKPFSFWAMIDGESHICVSDHLTGKKREFVMFHELAHHFWFSGQNIDQVHFFDSNQSKKEFEAHAFATIALCPVTVLQGLEDYEETDAFSASVRRDREKLFFQFREYEQWDDARTPISQEPPTDAKRLSDRFLEILRIYGEDPTPKQIVEAMNLAAFEIEGDKPRELRYEYD